MKKVSLAIICIVLFVSIFALSACLRLSSPDISVSEKGLTFTHNDASRIEYKVDDGEWKKGTTLEFSSEEGSHIVSVRVTDGEKVAEAQFTYTTKAVNLSDILVEQVEASWTAVGKTVSIKIGDGQYSATTSSSFTAQEVGATQISIKAEGGFDESTSTFYAGETVEKQATISISKLATPVLDVNENGLTWAAIDNATKYQVKVGEGEFVDATSHIFSSDEGNYTVSVKAIGNGTSFLDSDVATFTYEVKAVSATITKTASNTASWVTVGIKTQTKFGSEEYADNDQTTFTTTQSGELFVKALPGWDSVNKILYVGNASDSCKLIIEADGNYLIENADNASAASLSDLWSVQRFGNNGWEDTSATIDVAAGYNGTQAVKFASWNNFISFRYTVGYTITDGYDAISMDIKGDGIITLKLQLQNLETGVYATINLGVLSANWTHYDISIYDSDWVINYGGTDYTLTQVMDTLKMSNLNEMMEQFDILNFIFYGEDAGYIASSVLMDNLYLANISGSDTTSQAIMHDLGTHYSGISGTTVFDLEITNNNPLEGVLKTLNLQSNMSVPVSIEMDGVDTVLKDKDSNGQAITIVGLFDNGGSKINFVSASGSYAAVVEGITFNKVYAVEDFESYTETGIGYDKTHGIDQATGLRADWFAEYYAGSGSSPLSGPNWSLMGSSDYIQLAEGFNSNNSLKLKASTNAMKYVSMDLLDGSAKMLGRGTTFSFWAKGGATAQNVVIRVIYVNKATANIVSNDTVSSTKAIINIPANSNWTHYEVTINDAKEVYGFTFMFNDKTAVSYPCFDNFAIYTASPYAKYVSPLAEIIAEGAITATNNVDAASVDLTGLTLTSKYADNSTAPIDLTEVTTNWADIRGTAGEAQLVISYTEDNITKSVTVPITISAEVVIGEANLNLDYENTAGGDADNAAIAVNWTQEKYVTSWEVMTGVQMRNRARNGDKVINMSTYVGQSRRYTYNATGANLGYADFFSIDLGNYWTPTQTMKIKVVLVDTKGNSIYVLGDSATWFEFAGASEMTTFTKKFDKAAIQAISVIVQGTNGGCYVYVDDIILMYKGEAKVLEDFEDGAGSGAYVNDKWTQEQYTTGWTSTTGQMNSRNRYGSKVTNFAVQGNMTKRFTYNATGEKLGKANYFSIEAGNDFSGATTIQIKIILIDSQGQQIYIMGDASTFANFEATASGTKLPIVIDNFGTVDVQAIVVVAKGTNGSQSQYLYVDNMTLEFREPAASDD